MRTHQLRFSVAGIARPQGSLRAFQDGRRTVVKADNAQLASWRRDVSWAAQTAARSILAGVALGPVQLALTFHLQRPASVGRSIRPHIVKPDLDKLVRAVGDAMTGIVYRDDAQVTVTIAAKRYVDVGIEPHVDIEATVTDEATVGGTADVDVETVEGQTAPGISTLASGSPPPHTVPLRTFAPGPGGKSQKSPAAPARRVKPR